MCLNSEFNFEYLSNKNINLTGYTKHYQIYDVYKLPASGFAFIIIRFPIGTAYWPEYSWTSTALLRTGTRGRYEGSPEIMNKHNGDT